MPCQRCGLCCQTVGFGVNPHDDADTRRFHELHGFVYQADGQHFVVKTRCEALHVTDEGVAGCGLYDTRPAICRDYVCERARD